MSSFHSGFVGLIGLPNAGKSTLLNSLVKEKISIVTPKPQTTRRRILGIVNSSEGQAIFVDSPGVLEAKEGLNAFLSLEAKDVIKQSDVLVAVLNPDAQKKEDIKKIINMVLEGRKPWLAVITKVDLVKMYSRVSEIKKLLNEGLAQCSNQSNKCHAIIEYSNIWNLSENEWRDQLLSNVVKLLPETPAPLYELELFTPHTERELTAELVREKCFEVLEKEVPYGLAVRVDKFDDSSKSLYKIYVSLVVARESYKPIVIGSGGRTIKQIGIKARKELEKMLGVHIFLKLDVVVRPNWFSNKNIMKDFGYVVEKRK